MWLTGYLMLYTFLLWAWDPQKCCWHFQKLVKISLPEIWSPRSSQEWINLALSFHAKFPISAALKLVKRSAACMSPSEDAHALSGACCQKGSMSHYLLRFLRSTLRPVCQQPTVLKTEKVQEHFAELLMWPTLARWCYVSGSNKAQRSRKWYCGGTWQSQQPVFPLCTFPLCLCMQSRSTACSALLQRWVKKWKQAVDDPSFCSLVLQCSLFCIFFSFHDLFFSGLYYIMFLESCLGNDWGKSRFQPRKAGKLLSLILGTLAHVFWEILKFGCSILDKNCDFKHSCLQNTRYATYQELFIFQICLEIVSGMVKGIYSWPIFSSLKQNFLEKTYRLPWQKEKGTHLMLTRSENIYFNSTNWYLSETLLAEMILWKIMFINILEQIALSWHKPTINVPLNKFYLQVLDLWLLLQRLSVH